ncbi:hypothetical protein BVRB_1g004710 [Beta vulgaris subsp. vulgaris]|nr:hypothetical protein BVRB_1g004710 [Beta vulgaris subsp. vulgaris]
MLLTARASCCFIEFSGCISSSWVVIFFYIPLYI